ncbi:MAG TPA: metalloregulator ArsR/SmtB family transcription factor [bacterium]|nr:metalloregulator ArsR/SmtB family transcription factor [bacterium]
MIADYAKESRMLKALAHPVRLRMVEGLLGRECNVDKMVKALKLPQSTVSQHLAVLRERGIVHQRKEGVRTCYRVVDPRVAAFIKVLTK